MQAQFTEEARASIIRTHAEAERLASPEISPGHLLFGLLSEETAATRLLQQFEIEPELLLLEVQAQLRNRPGRATQNADEYGPKVNAASRLVLDQAVHEALRLGQTHIGTEHVLLGILRHASQMRMTNEYYFVSLLRKLGLVSQARLRAAALNMQRVNDAAASVLLQEAGLDLRDARLLLCEGKAEEEKYLTDELVRVIRRAHELTHETGCGRIAPGHLWLSLLRERDSPAYKALESTGMALGELDSALRKGIRSDNKVRESRPRFTAEAKRVMANARREATSARCQFIGSEHLLLVLLGVDQNFKSVLMDRLNVVSTLDRTLEIALQESELTMRGFSVASLREVIVPLLRRTSLRLSKSGNSTNSSSFASHRTWQIIFFAVTPLYALLAALQIDTRHLTMSDIEFALAIRCVLPTICALLAASTFFFRRPRHERELGLAFLLGFTLTCAMVGFIMFSIYGISL